ncbi:ZBED1 protein, partial [Amia calva]|nr:ZBED1 protein [Amia calva]
MCQRVVPTSSRNTSNLFHHLKQFNPIEYSEKKPMQQTQMAAFVPHDKQSKCHKDITKAVTNFLAKDMMLFSTVENVGFRKMMSVIDPRYQGRKYFSRTTIPTLYGEARERVEEQLKLVSYFATTADLWSSRTSEPYLSLTVHFIDQDWKLVSLCLQTVYFPEDHTGEAIGAGLTDALASWGLGEDRQVCITTDSGTNIIKAAELNRWTRLQCFRHRAVVVKEEESREEAMGDAFAAVPPAKKTKRSLVLFCKQAYLCIQATSSPSKMVFSTGSNIVTCKRASLKPDNVDQLAFLATNL